jgi:3-hydroxymyristoyl/3-hydroxydecanoyl-(acyl carrier protein) dehydratase
MGVAEIEEVLPHRAPFRLVDEVVSLAPEGIVAAKYVDPADPYLLPYEARGIYPAVLILEALAQAGGIFAARMTHFDPAIHVMYLLSFTRARFRAPVRGDDTLNLEVRPLRVGPALFKLRGVARVGARLVASTDLVGAGQPR